MPCVDVFFVCFLQVNIWVPQPEKQLDVIKVTGLAANVERAKQGLMERVKELQAEQEDRVPTLAAKKKKKTFVCSRLATEFLDVFSFPGSAQL